jgi:hypothetical protein
MFDGPNGKIKRRKKGQYYPQPTFELANALAIYGDGLIGESNAHYVKGSLLVYSTAWTYNRSGYSENVANGQECRS